VNIFVIAIISIAVTSVVFFILHIDDNPTISLPAEHYAIKITGLKDTYHVGEPYSFSYVLSGFGNACGSKTITFPINKTHSDSIGYSASCAKTFPINFVLDVKETYGTTYGHIALQEAGNYTVKVWFEKGINGPSIAEKRFQIIKPDT
jgi:hypothetical protein